MTHRHDTHSKAYICANWFDIARSEGYRLSISLGQRVNQYYALLKIKNSSGGYSQQGSSITEAIKEVIKPYAQDCELYDGTSTTLLDFNGQPLEKLFQDEITQITRDLSASTSGKPTSQRYPGFIVVEASKKKPKAYFERQQKIGKKFMEGDEADTVIGALENLAEKLSKP